MLRPFARDLNEFIYRLPNYPDFIGILPILLENPESRLIRDWDRENPDCDICSAISKRMLMILTQELERTHNRVCFTKTDIQKTLKTAQNIN